MFSKIISLVMSAVMTLTGMSFPSFDGIVDAVSEMIFGIPATLESINSDFLYDIDILDITKVNDNSGFVNNKVMVFVNKDTKFLEKRSLFRNSGGVLVGWSTPADLYVIHYPVSMTYDEVLEKCNELSEKEGVELAIPVAARRRDTQYNSTPNDSFSADSGKTIEWDEKDPSGRNWWLEAIQARQAWDYSNYFSTVNIGIVDAGYDLDHPDLEGKISFPSTLHALRNSVDSHGCHVAGIIGAKHNNGVGIAGVCDNSNLICVDWTPGLFQFWFTELAIFFGFSSVVQAGAKVVNFSLGTSSSLTGEEMTQYEETFVPMAVSYMMSSLLSKGYDFIAVQSAGNGDYYSDPIDARYNGHFCNINEINIFTGSNNIPVSEILDRIIIVGSVSNEGSGRYVQSDFSNTGSKVSIAAPGEKIYSCSAYGDYTELDGTSMSAPIVTGVASLVWSVNPSFKGTEVKKIVCEANEAVAEINRETNYFYNVELVEYPVVNAKLAVEEAIRRTDKTVGTVQGYVSTDAEEIEFDGVSHTVFSDGSFSFVTPAASGIANVKDSVGNIIESFNIEVTAGETTYIG